MTQHIKYSEHVISDNVKAYRDDSFASFLDNFKINILDEYYDKENSLFKKRIDFLNMRFYIETEKCLDSKIDIQLCKDKLLLILFKQIFLYMEEIERLHKLIKEKDKTITSKKDKISFQHKYKDLKEKLKLCECKFKTLNDSYLKMKNDYDDLKMQNEIYCEQIKSIIEDNNGKDIRDLNKFKEYPNINLMPISVAKESNFEIHSIKETNENRLDNDKTSCFSHFLHNNMNTSDKNCKHTGNDHTNYTSFKKESIEVNNININLNLNWKDNNHKNINAKINYNKKSENTKGEIAKAYKTVSNSTKMSNIEKNTPMKIKQDKPEVNTKIKTKNKNVMNYFILILKFN